MQWLIIRRKNNSEKALPLQGNIGKNNEMPDYLEVKVCEKSLSLSTKEEGLVSKNHDQDGAPTSTKYEMESLDTELWKVAYCSEVLQREADIKNYEIIDFQIRFC